MERKTPLYDVHVAEGGKIVPFAGYLLPVQYGTGVIQEHMAVRQQAGLFDVSHMGEILFTGPTALDTINHLLTNDYNGMAVNKVRYGAMCNADGGTIDDLVVYKFGDECYLAVVNAANREKDYAHMAANVLPAPSARTSPTPWPRWPSRAQGPGHPEEAPPRGPDPQGLLHRPAQGQPGGDGVHDLPHRLQPASWAMRSTPPTRTPPSCGSSSGKPGRSSA